MLSRERAERLERSAILVQEQQKYSINIGALSEVSFGDRGRLFNLLE